MTSHVYLLHHDKHQPFARKQNCYPSDEVARNEVATGEPTILVLGSEGTGLGNQFTIDFFSVC